MARLFGTDGVRGVANRELTCKLAMEIGMAGAYALTSEVHHPRILLGRDTRLSGDMLSAALTAGICAVGGDVVDVGVVPTPALAYLVRMYKADAAVMISASHNTMEYNGIKWFDGKGFKLSDEIEDRIEELIAGGLDFELPVGEDVGRVTVAALAAEEYIDFLKSTARKRYDGITVALDCANGAASAIAAKVFEGLGAKVYSRADEPDGININKGCGSTHPERLQKLVMELGADVGFAFDGDADRLIATDERGNIVDGDRIMGICAQNMRQRGVLSNDTLVVTVMSNLGLKRRMAQLGIAVSETKVGDRYVLERMLEEGYVLGGEQSGHVIFLGLNTTGDGILTAIQALDVVVESGRQLSDLAAEVPIYPQVLVNVQVENTQKAAAMEDEEMWQRIHKAEAEMGESGRVLVRASGTEPLIRVMLEGEDTKSISAYAADIARVLVKRHGGRIKV